MSGFLLTSTFDDCFDYKGQTIHLDLSFDNILRVFELFSDPVFSPYEKIEIAIEMFIFERELFEDIDLEEKNSVLLFIFKEFLDIDIQQQNDINEQRAFDFEQDAGIIYASFLHSYNMDLFEQHGKLHWKKFIQLFQHLDDKSKFKEVVNIRQMPLPKPDKHNEEYRKQIQKMKQIYALNSSENAEDPAIKVNKKLSALANSLKPK